MESIINKASILTEALPYIKKFSGITVVIKYGGAALVNEDIKETIIKDIALMKFVGFKPVVVHGGKHCLVEQVNGFIELGTCQTGGIHQFGTAE